MAEDNITAEVEERFWLDDKTPIVVQKKPAEPIALRISLGGKPGITIGYYIVYRGDEERILECLEQSVVAFKKYLAIRKGKK